MKLEELFTSSITSKKIKKRFNNNDEISKNLKNLDSDSVTYDENEGLASKNAPVKNDPHLHKKWNRVATKNLENKDPYWLYVKAVSESGIAESNPHFPRVYDIKTLNDIDHKQKSRAIMESLHSIHSLNSEQHMAIINDMMDMTETMKHTLQHYIENGHPIYRFIVNAIDRFITGGPHKINNDLLLQALKFVKNMGNKHGLDFDLHEGNIMFRLGRHTPQLVITDPFSPTDTYIRTLAGFPTSEH